MAFLEVRDLAKSFPSPAGVRPCAVAMFATEPASTSAWVMVYGLDEQVMEAPGANVDVGQVTATAGPAGATSWSSTFRL